MFKPCAVIPIYNHGATVAPIVARFGELSLACILVDDGSDDDTKRALEVIVSTFSHVELLTLPKNQGKGKALIEGFRRAKSRGYSHAVQIDADGQHDIEQTPVLLDIANKNRHALVSGEPIYDQSVPKARYYGRYLTHFFVSLETLTCKLMDSMCGFRVYPIDETLEQISPAFSYFRMTFDTEIMVRLSWAGAPIMFSPVRVVYPEDGISHFSLVKDNLRITWMHIRLVLGMLLRAPLLLWRALLAWRGPSSVRNKSNDVIEREQVFHWSEREERGSFRGLLFSLWCYTHFRRPIVALFSGVVVSAFFLFGREARFCSRDYLRRVYDASRIDQNKAFKRLPGWWQVYRHMLSFGSAVVDRLGVFSGRITTKNLVFPRREEFLAAAKSGKGAVLLTAHLGSMEMLKTIASQRSDIKLNVLAFNQHMRHFNRLVKKLGIKADIELIQTNAITPATAMIFQQKINNGEFIVIASDRTPAGGGQRVTYAEFLGSPAAFPQGAFILASLLACPVHTIFCVKDRGKHHVYFEQFADQILLSRHDRESGLVEYVQRYADRLAYYCKKAPYQWFNYFNFWARE